MPNLNHSGPKSQGPKTGRKLGKCRKTDDELKQISELGKGQEKRHRSKKLSGQGIGKRTNYFQIINKKGE